MIHTLTLRNRFVAACIVLSGVIALFFSFMVYRSIHTVETDLFGDALSNEIDWLIQVHGDNRPYEFSLPEQWELYKSVNGSDEAIPPDFRQLSLGFHEVFTAGADFLVYVKEADGKKFVLAFDQSNFEQREQRIMLILALLVLVSLVLGGFVGIILSAIALQPITNLAQQVEGIDPERPEPVLTPYHSDDVVGRLASTFDDLMDRIRYYLMQEKLFTGDVSHELRTPLAVVSGAVDVLAKQPQLSIKEKNLIERINVAIKQMSDLIQAFILLSKEGSKNSETERDPVIVNSIAAAELLAVEATLDKTQVSIRFVENAFLRVRAINELLQTVIRNLIQNAGRYTQKGTIAVTINPACIEIVDTGSGIPEIILDGVFRQKVRVSSTDPQGHGLGLAIVKRICDFNGWVISVGSTDNGTRFVIHFPRDKIVDNTKHG